MKAALEDLRFPACLQLLFLVSYTNKATESDANVKINIAWHQKEWFTRCMSTKQIHLLTFLLWLIDVPLMVGDKYHNLGLPGWLSTAWPGILIGAGLLDKALRVWFEPQLPAGTLPQAPQSPFTPTSPSTLGLGLPKADASQNKP